MRGPGGLGGDTPRGALHPQASFLLVHLHTSSACCAPAQGEPRPLKGGLTDAVLGVSFQDVIKQQRRGPDGESRSHRPPAPLGRVSEAAPL